MSESEIPGKKSGSGIVLLGAFFLLVAGGAVYFRLQKGGGEEVVEEKVTRVEKAPSPVPTLDEAPPPPPSEDELKEKEPAPSDAPAGPAKGSGGCSGECKGQLTPALQSGLRARGGQARGCYDRALRNNSMLEGKLTVQVRIGPMGTACDARITADSLGDPAVSSCVTQIFKSAKFPAPTGGCVDTAVPLNFVAKQ